MVYFLVFASSLIFCLLAGICRKKIKFLFFVFSLISVLIPAVFAGLRASSVGTDVEWYIIPNLALAKNQSYIQFMSSLVTPEYLFYTIIYISNFFSNPIFVSLFLIEFLIITPIYISAFLNNKNIHPCFILFAFFMLIYNFSFSLMRQFLAASFILLGFSLFYYRRKKVAPLLLLICSVLFHTSSLFIIGILIIFYLFRNRTLFLIFLSCFMLLCIASMEKILLLLSNFSDLFYRYYISYINREDESSFFTIEIIIFIVILLIFKFTFSNNKLRESQVFLYFLLLTFGVLLSLGSIFSSYVIRFSYYFRFFGIYALSASFNNEISVEKKLFCRIGIIILLIIYWIYFIPYKNFYDTYPYQFA